MNRQKFLKSLPALSGWRETAFLLALAERALPNLQLYLENAYEQDAQAWSDLMSRSWKDLIERPSEDGIVELLDAVTAPLESLEQDENYGAIPSLDCLWLWEQALLSELNREVKRASEASQRSLETVTGFIEFSEGQDVDEQALIKLFDRHPLTEREFSFQAELADSLRGATRAQDAVIRAVRELACDEGVSNIGISLDDASD